MRKLFALLLSIFILAIGAMFSVVLIAVVAVLGVSAWIYFWWKLRRLRQLLKEAAMAAEGNVIEGEVIVSQTNKSRLGVIVDAE